MLTEQNHHTCPQVGRICTHQGGEVMKVQATLWIIILFLTVANLFVTVKSRLERAERAALEQETRQLIEKWEAQDSERIRTLLIPDAIYQGFLKGDTEISFYPPISVPVGQRVEVFFKPSDISLPVDFHPKTRWDGSKWVQVEDTK